MSRCKACDAILQTSEMYTREVEEEDGTIITVPEDMCSRCRQILLDTYDEEDDIDLIESMAIDMLKELGDDYYE